MKFGTCIINLNNFTLIVRTIMPIRVREVLNGTALNALTEET